MWNPYSKSVLSLSRGSVSLFDNLCMSLWKEEKKSKLKKKRKNIERGEKNKRWCASYSVSGHFSPSSPPHSPHYLVAVAQHPATEVGLIPFLRSQFSPEQFVSAALVSLFLQPWMMPAKTSKIIALPLFLFVFVQLLSFLGLSSGICRNGSSGEDLALTHSL